MDLNCMKINVKRIKAGMFTMLIIVAALIGRLFYIQMMCHEELAETAQAQYEITIEGMDTRGQIFDRNMKPLTGRVKQYYYIIKNRAENKRGVMLLENMGGRRLTSTNGKHLVYRTENFDRKVNERLKEEYGCYVFCSYGRYEENQLGCHLIGYLSDWEKKGVSGLEYMYENKLAASEGRFTVTADAAGNIIQGIAPEIKEERELLQDNYIITTIDYELQKKCESLLSGSAACVVADVYTGEILAMASSPGFNPGKISEYLDGDSDCLINKTLQSGYPPGSVFKLVTAAAALENGVCAAARTFECTGQVAVGGVQVSCATAPEGGHGTIDMAEAMACSCNCYFAQLGELTGSDKILEMAERLGFGHKVLRDFPEETGGNLPLPQETGIWDISNISIGQGTILATPLQITKLVSIIASGGSRTEFAIVKEADKQAAAFVPVNQKMDKQVISQSTALRLEDMMKKVMTQGTCSSCQWDIPVWGKSGTAEASLRGQQVKNCWLAGFCQVPATRAEPGSAGQPVPYNSGSRYAITVFAEDGISGSATALPVFREIAYYLSKNYS